MKIQLEDGTELMVPHGDCPKCFLDVDHLEGNRTKMVQHASQPAKISEIDMVQRWVCPDCDHQQFVVIDNPDYVKNADDEKPAAD